MSVSRIQKLLFSEYCDFEDMVIVESPFAQTTKEGKGIRQVHLGEIDKRISPLFTHFHSLRSDSIKIDSCD